MPDLYPITEVKRESVRESEDMGSKDKFWYLHPTEEEGYWLFKYPRCNTGEHWAEKIAAEVADLLGISHARVELAIFEETTTGKDSWHHRSTTPHRWVGSFRIRDAVGYWQKIA